MDLLNLFVVLRHLYNLLAVLRPMAQSNDA